MSAGEGLPGRRIVETRVTDLIGVDWGTSSLRAYLIGSGGVVLDRRETSGGITMLPDRDFDGALSDAVGDWRLRCPGLPILLSGMIGSRQGWHEAPYADCPISVEALASDLTPIESRHFGRLHVVPGLKQSTGRPDVMRGEETQIIGALRSSGKADGVFVLPGTHSKWVRVEAGRVVSFTTYMTGEVFAALKNHTILGALMQDVGGTPAAPVQDAETGRGFQKGLFAASELADAGDLLSALFGIRVRGLMGDLAAKDSADFLSGLLIGSEFLSARGAGERLSIIGNAELTSRYGKAAEFFGSRFSAADAECAPIGHYTIARAAGLLRGVEPEAETG